MAFWQGVFDKNFQLYQNQRVDERLSYYVEGVQQLQFPTGTGVVDVWSDGRCYSPATDSYVRPINSPTSKSKGFPS